MKKIIPILKYYHSLNFFKKNAKKRKKREHLIILWAVIKVLESFSEILQESGTKHVLVNTKLMPGLSNNGINHIQTRDF